MPRSYLNDWADYFEWAHGYVPGQPATVPSVGPCRTRIELAAWFRVFGHACGQLARAGRP